MRSYLLGVKKGACHRGGALRTIILKKLFCRAGRLGSGIQQAVFFHES